jgi:hypothetical protein
MALSALLPLPYSEFIGLHSRIFYLDFITSMNLALPKDQLNSHAAGSSFADWPKMSGHNYLGRLSILSQQAGMSAEGQVVEVLEEVAAARSREVRDVAGPS